MLSWWRRDINATSLKKSSFVSVELPSLRVLTATNNSASSLPWTKPYALPKAKWKFAWDFFLSLSSSSSSSWSSSSSSSSSPSSKFIYLFILFLFLFFTCLSAEQVRENLTERTPFWVLGTRDFSCVISVFSPLVALLNLTFQRRAFA